MELYEYWNESYINAARVAYPQITGKHELSVGFKITSKDGTTHNGYYWPLVNGNHDLPVLHESYDWQTYNASSCPNRAGDGLCLVEQGKPIHPAASGGVRLMDGVAHVLVYPTRLARTSELGKHRTPWAVDVDCFDLGEFIRSGRCSANLSSANLYYANLSSANLYSADLSSADLISANLRYANLSYANLSSANLHSADLSSADLYSADLSSADLYSANLYYASGGSTAIWPTGFDWAAKGVRP